MLQHHHTKHQIVSLEELLRPKEKDINNNLNNLNNNSPTIPIIETTDAEDSEGDVKKEPIRVCVRIRPLNAKERKRGDDTVIDYDKISISVSGVWNNFLNRISSTRKCLNKRQTQETDHSLSICVLVLRAAKMMCSQK